MKNLALFALTLILVSACGEKTTQLSQSSASNRNVLGGEKILSIYARDFEPLLKLTFSGSDNRTYTCSALHIGKGWILTANHCLAQPMTRDKRMPLLTINQYARRRTIGPLTHGQYKPYTPAATSKVLFTEGDFSYYLQTPDLLAIKLEGRYGSELALNQKALLPTEELKKEDESKLRIAGFGETGLHRKDYGTLHSAPVFMWYGSENSFQLTQQDPNNKIYAAALPGDSGGPLYLRNEKNEMVVYGIFSTYNSLKMANGTYMIDNNYARTEKGSGAEWLKLLLQRL